MPDLSSACIAINSLSQKAALSTSPSKAGLTQDVLNALATRHHLTPWPIKVGDDGSVSAILERDDVDDRYCQALITVMPNGAVTCATGLYRERAIINNGWISEPSVEVAIANAAAAFDNLVARHAQARIEDSANGMSQ